VWFPVCPLKEALLYKAGQLGARSLSAVRNQEASACGRFIKHKICSNFIWCHSQCLL